MTHKNSTNGARNDTSTASIPRLTGWRHSATWTYLIMLIGFGSGIGSLVHTFGRDAAAGTPSC